MKQKEVLYYYRQYLNMIRFDAEGDEGGEQQNNKPKHSGAGTRLPYGLCKAAGIDVPDGTTPKGAWELLEGKTGITAKDVYKHIKDKKTVKSAVKAIKEEKPEIKVPKGIGGESDSSSYESRKGKLDSISSKLRDRLDESHGGIVTSGLREELDAVKTGKIITFKSRSSWSDAISVYRKRDDGEWERCETYGTYRVPKDDFERHFAMQARPESVDVLDDSVSAKDILDGGIKNADDFNRLKDALFVDSYTFEGKEKPYTYDDLDKAFPEGTVFKTFGTLVVKTKDGYASSRFLGYKRTPEEFFEGFARRDYGIEYESSKKDIPSGKDKNDKKTTALETDSLKTVKGLKTGDFIELDINGKHYRFTRVRGAIRPPAGYEMDLEHFAGFVDALKSGGMLKAEVYTDREKTPEERKAEREAAKARKEARENAKLEAQKPYEPTGQIHERPSSLENYDEMMKPIRESIKITHGLSDDDVEFMESSLKTLFEKYDYLMRFDGNVVGKILDSHFMNQLESKTSHGYLGGSTRKRLSHRLFGSTGEHNEDPDYFEKYGYCDSFEDIKNGRRGGMASGYGGVVVKFRKDRVAERTTYTADDSLDSNRSHVAGRAGSNPTFEGLTYWVGVKGILDIMRSTGGNITPRHISGCYLELQYHGRLTFEDVEEIMIPNPETAGWRDRVSEADINRLKEKGVKVFVEGKGYV